MTRFTPKPHKPGDSERIALPWPPSTNNLFATAGGRRVTSKDYALWKREAGWTLLAQRPKKHHGMVTISVELCKPHSRRFDLDNRLKPVLDLLVEHGVIKDDSDQYVQEVNVKSVDNAAPCVVTVRAFP
jgi:crossover junction endodeoxyribonuclease RusA